MEIVEDIDIKAFQKDLIDWFSREQRDLPWRKDQDPYKVWVSEVMLQQTKVDTVIPYFTRFLEQFPSIDALAGADEEKVLKAWEGLGYYSRVRNLQAAVREVKERYGGKVPDTPEAISTLKGVGPYTAGAVLSIAYGKPEPAVDGNVMRVLSRILLIYEDIAKPSARKTFERAVRQLIDHGNPSYFNQALMELGALICTPTSPSCLLCPVNSHCEAYEQGAAQELPVKSKKKKQKTVELAAALLHDEEGRLLIRKRPATGLLGNLWEFPNTEVSASYPGERGQLQDYLGGEYKSAPTLSRLPEDIQHVFTHLIWNIRVFAGCLVEPFELGDNCKLVSRAQLAEYAMPVSHQKILKLYDEWRKTP
ncbi:A/G-specific adenine glycosylase [Bacillus massilinigeriensis]|uniref:A/G-specific adenine glycosylase n=1 Tax=Bacillus mediterraneensis TaxID=1805474 RepID=UPI0008F852A3|nr:A/G-specific adenine glycosylase [Bacillus mediterraneensis]